MGTPIPAPPPPPGVVVTLDQIYTKVVATHEAVQPLLMLPQVIAGQERRIRSLENWRLFLLGVATVSFGTATASLFQIPILNK